MAPLQMKAQCSPRSRMREVPDPVDHVLVPVFPALADAGLEIFVKIPSDWLAHCADNHRAPIHDGGELRRLQKPKPLDRHLHQRVVQALNRGLFEPLL
jgi:hypothetical protein